MGTSESSAPERSIFICYRRADSSDITDRIYDWLDREFPGAVFMDVDAIPLGVDFRHHIRQELDTCRIMLVVIGPDWLKVEPDSGMRRIDSPFDHVRFEITTALARGDVRIIPVFVQDAKIPSTDVLPPEIKPLAYRNGLQVRRNPDFSNDIGRVIRHMRRALEESSQTRAAQAPHAASAHRPTPGEPWENSLGMKFVPVPGTEVLFSVWETRRKDFEAFVKATEYDTSGDARKLGIEGWLLAGGNWKEPGFDQTGDHPVVCVSWDDAKAFCKWLTEKERGGKKIGNEQEYRLPTDHEWSCAVGIGNEENMDLAPQVRNQIKRLYPWGKDWPPPAGVGNYAGAEAKTKDWPSDWPTIGDYNDNYPRTSPVGSFASNRLGIYDLGGNVWEWCEDKHKNLDSQDWRVLRGGSWSDHGRNFLLSSSRFNDAPGRRWANRGFRCVVTLEPSNRAG